ncbi:hypothetical protein DFH05DRAFT_294582 [Lentinula detonsa]|uniref:Uncharacterized protein n=1 Tax=Lentinula detonsa TaxID=2804962 RepID=A0A9W8NWG3_9AGAR|nr:hypothetical protein DFH05DRAFT_294582 [Lentinula detonsa]
MMVIHGPILMILSLLLGLLSTTANAAPLIRSINPIVPRASHSQLQLQSPGSENSPPPDSPPDPHADEHSNGKINPTPEYFYDIWFSALKPDSKMPVDNLIVPPVIQHETYNRILKLDRSKGPIGLIFLQSYPESEPRFWYQRHDEWTMHHALYRPSGKIVTED